MSVATRADSPPFWVEDLDTLCQQVEATPSGLTSEEARRRLEQVGPNDLAHRRKSALLEFILFFTNPLVLILLVAALVSGIMGEYVNASLIALIVALSVLLNFSQAYRSQQAADALRQLVVTTATVLRNGSWTEIPQGEVVPGDVIRLSAGDLIPADARLIDSQMLHANEAALTGESMPARKQAQPPKSSSALADVDDAVFLGTSVVSGSRCIRRPRSCHPSALFTGKVHVRLRPASRLLLPLPPGRRPDLCGSGRDREAVVLSTLCVLILTVEDF